MGARPIRDYRRAARLTNAVGAELKRAGTEQLSRVVRVDAAAGAEPGVVFVIEVIEGSHGVRFR